MSEIVKAEVWHTGALQNMQRIIIYGSEYGTTRRYAEKLSQ